ncbi:endolytic transglycosylase MltG [Bacillus sp. 2205SS5-2]|uniref:endolytic transglycosylase MltG n=1 Tax=Bacillus sp. 2205SS5-2 TaxID=3109031 RepID=UPI0030070BBE
MDEQKSRREQWWENLKERQNDAKLIRKIVLIMLAIVLFVVTGAILGGYIYIKAALQPVEIDSEKEVPVEIPIGSGVTTIGGILEENGIIHNATVFKYYVKVNNEADFQAGTYNLTPSMTLDEIITSLKTGKVYKEALFKLTVKEGITLEEIAKDFESKTPYSKEEFLDKINDKKFIEKAKARFPELLTEDIQAENIRYPLEGYLYPATYAFYEEKPAIEEMIYTILAKTDEVLADFSDLREEQEMSVHDLVTMSSLIEEEAKQELSRKKVASVFYNRLDEGMPLQTDPTVLYGMGKHKNRLFEKDYAFDSPYNTYQIQGLPPGPIANPSVTSLEAALKPVDTNYFYFLAAENEEGVTEIFFSETLAQHEELRSELILNN